MNISAGVNNTDAVLMMTTRQLAGRNTSLLLQKASAQLSGGQVASTLSRSAAAVNDDDDGLAVSGCCWCTWFIVGLI